jgi:hypothetical protein
MRSYMAVDVVVVGSVVDVVVDDVDVVVDVDFGS